MVIGEDLETFDELSTTLGADFCIFSMLFFHFGLGLTRVPRSFYIYSTQLFLNSCRWKRFFEISTSVIFCVQFLRVFIASVSKSLSSSA